MDIYYNTTKQLSLMRVSSFFAYTVMANIPDFTQTHTYTNDSNYSFFF